MTVGKCYNTWLLTGAYSGVLKGGGEEPPALSAASGKQQAAVITNFT